LIGAACDLKQPRRIRCTQCGDHVTKGCTSRPDHSCNGLPQKRSPYSHRRQLSVPFVDDSLQLCSVLSKIQIFVVRFTGGPHHWLFPMLSLLTIDFVGAHRRQCSRQSPMKTMAGCVFLLSFPSDKTIGTQIIVEGVMTLKAKGMPCIALYPPAAPKGTCSRQNWLRFTQVSLHSSYTAENWHVMCNEYNVMQKFYHPLRMTDLCGGRTGSLR
jgi:hypothetical protein